MEVREGQTSWLFTIVPVEEMVYLLRKGFISSRVVHYNFRCRIICVGMVLRNGSIIICCECRLTCIASTRKRIFRSLIVLLRGLGCRIRRSTIKKLSDFMNCTSSTKFGDHRELRQLSIFRVVPYPPFIKSSLDCFLETSRQPTAETCWLRKISKLSLPAAFTSSNPWKTSLDTMP